ncbi:MAG: GNAT family N-acetyltransferase [Gammaproteobacteria bacterium]|jgi:predicted N-acyltransferase
MNITIVGAINEVTADEWNALAGEQNPFIRYEFLSALETHHCVGDRFGWIPQHITLRDHNNKLIGAVPLYLKDNSYGEFVFDWGWADAYHRHGLEYYPKLVVATPYTPATGPRLLIDKEQDYPSVATSLIEASIQHATNLNVSSLHWLFTNDQDTQQLTEQGFMQRLGCQFHWHNEGYESFDHYLQALSRGKRKNINQERRQVRDANVQLEILSGHDATERHWHTFHRYYESTFMKLGGYATLSTAFFQEVAQTMPDNVVLVMAKQNDKYIASALSFRSTDTLYGRHWGCEKEVKALHFEACYYQGIEYCINNGLQCFEPGAQGEHKIARGFLPTPTYSAHWVANPVFKEAISEFLDRETRGMRHYIEQLRQHSPFKQTR